MAKSTKITRADLPKFQKEQGLPVTGNFDAATRRNIKLAKKGKPLQTPAAKRARRKERRVAAANDPATLTAPLTPATLDRETEALIRQRFGGQERSAQDQLRASDEQQRRLGGYFDDYRRMLLEAADRTNAGYAQAAQQIEQNVQRDTASSDSPDAQKALAARQALSRSFGSSVSTQGASQNAYMADRGRIAGLSKVQAHQAETNRRRQIEEGLKALEAEKGDFATTTRAAARTSERNNLIAMQSLGLKVTQEQNDQTNAERQAADRKADNKRQREKDAWMREYQQAQLALTGRKVSNAESKDAYQRAHKLGPYKPASSKGGSKGGGTKGGKSGGVTPAVRRGAKENWDKALTIIGDSEAARKQRKETIVYLVTKGVPSVIAEAAWDHLYGGGVSDKHRSQVKRRYGVTLPRAAGAAAVGGLVDVLRGIGGR